MIFSEQWVREWVDHGQDPAALQEQLTMAGLEVDGIAPVAHWFEGIVVGEIVKVSAHPDADKLRVCQVNDGKAQFQVVCGAPNVRIGMKAPLAKVGAKIQLPEPHKTLEIKRTEIRGVESSGMLCSAEELGIEETSEGLFELDGDAETGQDIRKSLHLDDCSIELDLTPNRGDCLSIMGLAREIGALNQAPVKDPQINPVPAASDASFEVRISAEDACPRYLGRVIRGIDSNADTPLWMKEKLRRCGLRCIEPVVDVTNFVLIEMGQPMHAFDLARLNGAIDVRMARDGETITLLDGREVTLTRDTLAITDASGPIAIAGIMGGIGTAVGPETRDVFLECAYFAPLAIAGRARAYGLHTDASHRYERGVDHQLQAVAMERATQLLLDIVGGEAGPVHETLGNLPEPAEVRLRFASIPRFLGIDIEREKVRTILQGLGMEPVTEDEQGIAVRVPSYRFDIEIEADLVEELARLYGYNNIPLGTGHAPQTLASSPESRLSKSRVTQHLASQGYQEIITYSFVEPALAGLLGASEEESVSLQNPISADMSVMRTSVLPGLVSTLRYNENRQQNRIRVFEIGQVFRSGRDGIAQPTHIGGLSSGRRFPENWCNDNGSHDFFDIKGDVESLLDLGGPNQEVRFAPVEHPALHPGQRAGAYIGEQLVGSFGALHPSIEKELGLSQHCYVFELDLASVLGRKMPVARALSRYPEVSRDIAILVNNATPAADILALVYENAGECLTDLRIFDVYQGDAVETGKKSIALGLTWQHPSRTLNDDEVNEIIACCIKALEEKFEARLRTAG